MSDFACPVVQIGPVQKHFNADTLSVVDVDGCPVIVRTQDFKEGDLAVYLPVESMIPEDREWVKTYCSHLKFKNGVHRLKAARLRGTFSMGMLVPIGALGPGPTPGHGPDGTDVSLALGVTKYEEPEDQPHVQKIPEPLTFWGKVLLFFCRLLGLKNRRRKGVTKPMPTYSVAQYRKYKGVLVLGEEVWCSEKIHGSNMAVGYHKGKFWVSSHRVLRPVEDDSWYWRAVRYHDLKNKLKGHDGLIFYCEVFGPEVQDMGYGRTVGDLGLVFFDILDLKTGRYFDPPEIQAKVLELGLAPVPTLYQGPYDPEVVDKLKDGPSIILGANHFREGVVVKPIKNRADYHVGRVVLKLVGENYMLRKGPTTERH